ncbi:hypothetical protein [Lignipirellula cremea]|uniref:Uncharacterized protein n=1 Tax=Lignipirellula cremea TaxID=2528010 RepID=A0A518DQ71_9BACT|nr:hypothetical protein [Lignipirellula cremea]QDU93995.1 hypothetical protein Pla8534_17810 [Lignipirellula cremea]
MKKFLRYALALILLLGIGGACLVFGVFKAAQHEPEFYREALQATPEVHEAAGDVLEKHVLDLRNDLRREGLWEAIFTDEQINGWLASDLPEKFPTVLPAGVSDPRIAIRPAAAMIGCRYEDERVSTVLSLSLQLSLTDEPNVVAVRILGVRAGLLPVPITDWLDKITERARQSDIDLRWEQIDGDPVALVHVPVEHEDFSRRQIHIEQIEMRDGELYLAGISEAPSTGQSLSQTAAILKATDHR